MFIYLLIIIFFGGGGDLCWAETMLDRLQMHHILITVNEQL